VQPTSDGGYILGGTSDSGVSGNKTTPNFGGADYWLVKVDGSGNKQWEQVFGGSGNEQIYSVQPTSDGGYILGGYSTSGVSGNKTTPGLGGSDYWLVKVDGSGNKQWEKVFGGSGDDVIQSVQPTSDGGYLLGGSSTSGVSGNKTTPSLSSLEEFGDYWLVKVDGSGNKQWEQVFGGSGDDVLYSVQPTSDGGYILGGASHSGVSGNKTTPHFGNTDYWLVKLRPPAPPFLLTAGSFTNGTFTLHLSGLSGQGNVVIYASTNLTAWTAIFTNPPVTGLLDYVDSPPSNCPQRYYRAAE
jgi:protein involved in ribonucleotide reduction